MTSVESGDSRTRSWVGRKQRKPLTMNLTLKRTESDRSIRGAEKLLESVGLSADHLHDRIPQRFRNPSKLKGIDFDYQNIQDRSAVDRDLESESSSVKLDATSPTITGRYFFQYWISRQEKRLHDSPEIFMK